MPQGRIKKAVIPAAGFGTRLFPATKAIKKELFPVIDKDGRAKPAIMLIVEEAINAGIEEVAIITQPDDVQIFAEFFQSPPKPDLLKKLSPSLQEYSSYLQEIGQRVTILTQQEQEGYGHAVFCAKDWVNNEPFLLMLGDHIYSSNYEKSCARQVLDVYEQVQQSVVALNTLPAEFIFKAGCVTGVWQELNSILKVTQVYEKPTIEYARQYLYVEGMKDNEFLCVFGLYVLTPKIFDLLEDNIKNNFREKGEFQLTSCLETLRDDEGMSGYLVKGKTYDIGIPDAYWQTIVDFK
jgi:UTP--glucose-1-phosphate uridylyltransferase